MIFRRRGEITPVVKERARGGEGRMVTYPFVTEREAHGVGRLFSKLFIRPVRYP